MQDRTDKKYPVSPVSPVSIDTGFSSSEKYRFDYGNGYIGKTTLQSRAGQRAI
jgi:hypothetical protein